MRGYVFSFTSKASSAGIVTVMLGFVPDYLLLIAGDAAGPTFGTSPNRYEWFNHELTEFRAELDVTDTTVDRFPIWAAAQSLLTTGSTGVVTLDATGITRYDGGERLTADETTNTDGKHVDRAGLASLAGSVTLPGVNIPADHQVASAVNIGYAFQFSA